MRSQTVFTTEFPARSAEVARLPRDVKVESEVIAEIRGLITIQEQKDRVESRSFVGHSVLL